MVIEIKKRYCELTKQVGYSAKLVGFDSCWNVNRQVAINKLINRNADIITGSVLVIDKGGNNE
jgi:hypothetical protein